MTPELQRKALAQLDGWECFGGYTSIQDGSTVYWWFKNGDHFTDCVDTELPNYLESFDAIIPLIQKLFMPATTVEGVRWQMRFYKAFPESETILSNSPAKFCEALLRAHGKWIED